MKRKYSLWQFAYLLTIKAVILIIAVSLLVPSLNLVINTITESQHKESFYEAHYKDEPQIFFNSILGTAKE